MRNKAALEFFDWLWLRLREEPELEKALDDMLYIKRVKMEYDIKQKFDGYID